jgi:4-hydroxy-tetrahydrodipicolinate reductase
VVSINGVACLPATDPEAAETIDAAAREAGVAVVGTGVNPGFVLDLVPIFFAGACVDVTRICVTRVADIRPYGEAVLEMYGVGLTEDEFVEAVAEDRIPLHREIVHSAYLIAHALGIAIESVEERKLPVVADGRVVGFRHQCLARPCIELELQGLLDPPVDAGTSVSIDGDPDVAVVMRAGLTDQGGRVVVARVLNLLPWLVDGRAGLRSPAELPVALGSIA